MGVETDYRAGLTIPEKIKAELSYTVIKVLTEDGHGLSFPYPNTAQMRYIFKGENFGRIYKLSDFNGKWDSLLTRAMKDNTKLRYLYPNSTRVISPDRGVFCTTQFKKATGSTQHQWQLHFKKDGKSQTKSFYYGTDHTASTARKKHAELTAWHFRRLYCESGDASVLDNENLKNWQHQKYYDDNKFNDWNAGKR